MTRDELLEKILATYSRCYDIVRGGEPPLVARAEFHERQAGFVLVRRAETWAADRHEFAFFFSVPRLDAGLFAECVARVRELGGPLVHPKAGHMCTSLVAIFLCDFADEAAVRELRKFRYSKSFKLSLNGWMEVQTAAAVLSSGEAVSNAAGRRVAKFLKMELGGKRPGRKRLFGIF